MIGIFEICGNIIENKIKCDTKTNEEIFNIIAKTASLIRGFIRNNY